MGKDLAQRLTLPVSLPLCLYDVRSPFWWESRLTVDFMQYRPQTSSFDKHFSSFLPPGMKMKSTSVPPPRMSLWCWRRYVGSREPVACGYAHLRCCSFKSGWKWGAVPTIPVSLGCGRRLHEQGGARGQGRCTDGRDQLLEDVLWGGKKCPLFGTQRDGHEDTTRD